MAKGVALSSSFGAAVRGDLSDFALANFFNTEDDSGVLEVVLRQC